MNSSGSREATQAFFHGCCPNPILKLSEPDETIVKKQNTSAISRLSFVTTTSSSFFSNSQFTNHESIPSLEESFVQFTKTYPKYSDTNRIDRIRALEYPQLSLSNHVCLDYIGAGLFTQSQTVESSNSFSPSSKSSDHFPFFGVTFKSVSLKSQLLNGGGEGSEFEYFIRNKIMDFLNIFQNDYSMVFTANRSSAFKLVADSYPFQSSRKLLTVYDHESEAINTMIDESEKRGAQVMEAEFKWPRLRIHSAKLRKMIARKNNNINNHKKKKHRGLFVFPLQSRISGASYSYQWMKVAQENGWHVLLDACSLSPKDMDSFGLSLIRPDFIVCSFYKIFGDNPTGFACLLVKNSITPILEDTHGMGIVSITPAKSLHSFQEDSSGTDTELEQISTKLETEREVAITSKTNIYTSPNTKDQHSDNKKDETYHQSEQKIIVPAQESHNLEFRCLDHVDSLGLMLINSRGRYLINWLITAMMKLQHPNRLDRFPLVTIYGPKVKFDRGPALAFNIYDWKGERVEPAMVQKLADRNNISLSNGYIHHVWFPEKYEGERKRFVDKGMKQKKEVSSSRIIIKSRRSKDDHQGITVVTIALTFLADFEDVYRLWAFVARFLDADFVEKERWRYTSLNEKTIEI